MLKLKFNLSSFSLILHSPFLNPTLLKIKIKVRVSEVCTRSIAGSYTITFPTLLFCFYPSLHWVMLLQCCKHGISRLLGNLLPTASRRNLEISEDTASANKPPTAAAAKPEEPPPAEETMQDSTAVPAVPELSERRKALFEPLEPIKNINGRRPSAESLLPPPDFDSANYPKGWLIGKKRKLVNVDVVESMRRIAIQEMNRKVPYCCLCFLLISNLIYKAEMQGNYSELCNLSL